jgi:hypothetical protein
VPKSGTNVRSLADPTVHGRGPGMALKGRFEPFSRGRRAVAEGWKPAIRCSAKSPKGTVDYTLSVLIDTSRADITFAFGHFIRRMATVLLQRGIWELP